MNLLNSLVTSCWMWFRSFFGTIKTPMEVVYVEEQPLELKKNVTYVIGENGINWFVVMVCPCGCESTLQMSLLPDAKPRWSLVEHADGAISLRPSVWRIKGCKSHFFLRRGLIRWCIDD